MNSTQVVWKRALRILAALLVVPLMASVAGCQSGNSGAGASSDDPVTLRFVSFLDESSSTGMFAAWFMAEVESATNGAVKFDASFGPSLVPGNEIFPALQDGRMDAAIAVHSYSSAPFPLIRVAGIPFQTRNVPAAAAALNTLYEEDEDFRAEWDEQGLRVLQIVPNPVNVAGLREPLDSYTDYQSRRIRALDNVAAALEGAGAEVIAMSGNEIYEGLQRGLVDGFSSARLDVLGDLHLAEQAPHIVDDGTGVYGNLELLMNAKVWESLPSDIQAAINRVLEDGPAKFLELNDQKDAESCDAVIEQGGDFLVLPESDWGKWRDKVQPKIIEDWTASVGNDELAERTLSRYKELISQYESANGSYVSGIDKCVERVS